MGKKNEIVPDSNSSITSPQRPLLTQIKSNSQMMGPEIRKVSYPIGNDDD